jgi:hypothetical protein
MPILALFDLPCTLAQIGFARLARNALGSITPNLTYIMVVQGTEPQTGIKPGFALLLAFANATKPLQRRNGLVVLATKPL